MPTPTTYTYPAAAIPNSPGVDPGRLEFEINQSAIVTQVDPDGAVTIDGAGVTTIKFKDILSGADKLVLDGDSAQPEQNPALVGSILFQSNLAELLDEPPQEVSLVSNTMVSLAPATEVTLSVGTTVELSDTPDVVLGTLSQTGDQRYESWSIPQLSLTGSYQTVWQKASANAAFYESIFHLSSDRVDFRVEVDGVEVAEFDLSEMAGDFFLSTTGSSDGGEFPIVEYHSNRWRFRPLIPMRVGSDITFQMKAQTGNKTLYRGMSVWGPR